MAQVFFSISVIRIYLYTVYLYTIYCMGDFPNILYMVGYFLICSGPDARPARMLTTTIIRGIKAP